MTDSAALPIVSTDKFFACNLCVGKITQCALNPKARKPAYHLEIDRQVEAVVNFAPRNVAGVESQCLVLDVDMPGGVALVAIERAVEDGSWVY